MEATNGSFVYRDTFFANAAEGKLIPRATVADLNALLLPKKNAAPIKDETANFYIGQLMHYGLPKTKDKNTAKVRLTTALSAGQLAVPSHVQKIEIDLKKEYASLQRKAKLVEKKEKGNLTSKAATGQKRKVDAISNDTSTITRISVTMGDASFTFEQSEISATPKKQKTTATKKIVSATKPTPQKSTAKSPTPKPTKPTTVKAQPKATSKTTVESPQTARSNQHPSLTRPKQTARRSNPPVLHVSDAEDDGPPPPYSEHENQFNDDRHHQSSNVLQISGDYEVDAPAHDSNTTLNLRLYHPRDQLWGRFWLGDRQGLIRMDGVGNLARGVQSSFGWRSEDTDTRTDLKFGKSCDGWMEFDGNGGVRGVFFGFKTRGRIQDVSFRGSLAEDYSYESDGEREELVEDMEREWHSFPDRAYGR